MDVVPASDTAKLIASLELQDKFSKTADSANRKLSGLESATGKVGKSMGVFGNTVSTAMGVGLERAVSGGIRSFVGALKEGVAGAQELEAQQAQTQAAIESTGGAAGLQAEDIRKLAEKYEGLNATIDDKVIQSGENMLLTFTNINKDAFEPALQAALDMNTRFGGGEGGLQSTMVQLGKALNDPTKGLTSLRRVGVAFSDEQQKRIKQLQKEGDLYGAQKLILQELNKEFGGSFLAQGDTSAAKAAKFTDSMEDLKITLAQGVLPGLDRVRDRLTTLFTDPKTIEGVKNFGEKIGDFLSTEHIDAAIEGVKGLFNFLKEVPWGVIGDGLKASASATKTVVEAFMRLPPQVQTAILTGVAVNKISGGLAGSLVGKGIGAGVEQAVKFLFKKGDTPANPLFVADVTGGLGGGGGVPGVGGAGGASLGSKALSFGAKWVLGPAAAVALGAEIAKAINDPMIQPAKNFEQGAFKNTITSDGSVASLQKKLDAINNTLDTSKTLGDPGYDALHNAAVNLSGIPIIGDALGNLKPELEQQRDALQKKLDEVKREQAHTSSVTAHSASEHNRVIRQSMIDNSNRITRQIVSHAAGERADLQRLQSIDRQVSGHTSLAAERMRGVESASRATSANTDAIKRKNFSPTVDVNVHNAFSISNIINAQKTYSYVTATGRVGGKII